MSIIWENKFSTWCKPASDSEEQKLENAQQLIRNALNSDNNLQSLNYEVFGQGSYANNTNVRLNSDIDLNVRLFSTFYYNLPDNKVKEDFNIAPSSYTFSDYKNAIQTALSNYFGSQSIVRKNKCIKVLGNTTRIEADVVPTFEHRRYADNGTYISGCELLSDSGIRVINWPKQHIENGITKNTNTQRRFKRTVRIFKKLKIDLKENNISISDNVLSFLIECLVWNVPNQKFNDTVTWISRIKESIVFLYNALKDNETSKDWGEVSELLYLFHNGRKWTRNDAIDFLEKVWNHVGYRND